MRIGWKVACAIILIASTSVVMVQFQPKDGVLTKVIELKVQKGVVEIPNSTIVSVMTNLSVNKSFNSGLLDKRGKEFTLSEISGDKVAVYTTGLSEEEKQVFKDCLMYIKIYNETLVPIEGEINILEDEALYNYTTNFPTGEWDCALKIYGNTTSIEQRIDFNITMNLNISVSEFNATTNQSGIYGGESPLGEYILTCSKAGYYPQSKYVRAEAGETKNINFTLTPY